MIITQSRIQGFSVSVIDQFFLAGSNALILIVLSNILALNDYGQLATFYAVVVLFQMMTNAMYGDAFAVKLPSLGHGAFNWYLYFVIKKYTKTSVLFFSMIFILCYLFQPIPQITSYEIGAISFSAFSFSLFMFFRRSFYSLKRIDLSFTSTLLYVFFYFTFLLATHFYGLLSVVMVLVCIGVAALTTVFVILLKHRIASYDLPENTPKIPISELNNFHKSFSGWGSVSGFLKWVPDNLLFFLLGFLSSMESVAVYRMALNIIMPVRHFAVALINFIMPRFAEKAHQGKSFTSNSINTIFFVCCMFVLLNLVLFLLFQKFGYALLGILYNQNISNTYEVVEILVALPAIAGISAIFITFIKAQQKIKVIFCVYVIGALFSFFGGYFFIKQYGVSGAAFSLLATTLITMVCAGFVIYLWYRKSKNMLSSKP
jgi:O-antigen/teichoic acid export membrane protein